MTARSAQPPRACTNFRLRQLTRRVTQFYDAELGKTGLKTTQYSLLSHVLKLGPMDASTLTRNLKPLVDAGWVAVTAGSDARSRTITITPAGRALREAARSDWQRAQKGLEARLGPDRVIALHALIDESLALLDAPPEGDTE